MSEKDNFDEFDEFEEYEDVDEGDFDFQDEDGDGDEPLGEYHAEPFFSIYATALPDKFNPKFILSKRKILLFNPLDKITPYQKIIPEAMTLEVLMKNFIVNGRSLSDNYNLYNKNDIYDVVKNNKDLLKQFIEEGDAPETNSPTPKNNYSKGNPLPPKNNN